ncbi:TetR/AcrR family transcriptional regulator [Pseudomonas syringae]|uniref:TetR/AcrR family transcriptional regulator n=1 Tax=Pseudomonas syringae TaxID=317 RepID=UPI000BB5DCC3|nr:TetR/AcrR family transcriptional regulator [Pseudomonas syringae]MDU8500272.1 TetR/AcrR family transcriptional regulator [Pseudomonas syringae]PBP72047.1 hypothetical protein CCL21_06635 [Pseudomonas syringae]
MPSHPDLPQRMPQQARGRQRYERILDACASLIVANGLAGLKMSDIGKECDTAIGSLYHFFPNKDAVLNALRARILEDFIAILREINSVDPSQWSALSTSKFVHRLVMPLVYYVADHPECLIISDNAEHVEISKKINTAILDTFNFVFKIRMPGIGPDQRNLYIKSTLGLPIGMIQIGREHPELKEDLLRFEIPRALVGYLASLKQLKP